VTVPLPTNVYTAFEPYYADYGLVGMLVAMFVIGVGQTWLFWKAQAGRHLYIFLFAISLYPLVMVAFDDQYSLMNYYALATVFGAVYFRISGGVSLRERVGSSALSTT
jgi:oligosaccharide repeat unit polymerase